MLPRKGKAPCTAVPSDDEDAATAPISGREAQSRAGVLRQLRPDAQDQRVAASKAAAAKRSAGAMPKEERQAKRAKHMKEVRERQRAERAVAAAEAAAAEPSAAVAAARSSAAESSAANPSAADPSTAEPSAAEPSAAEPSAAVPAAEPFTAEAVIEPAAVATPPDLELFNEWLQRGGHEQAEEDEWDEFAEDGAFDDAQPEDLQSAALLELFIEWRGSDRQQERAMDQRVHDWNCSSEALDRDPPPPVFPRTTYLYISMRHLSQSRVARQVELVNNVLITKARLPRVPGHTARLFNSF